MAVGVERRLLADVSARAEAYLRNVHDPHPYYVDLTCEINPLLKLDADAAPRSSNGPSPDVGANRDRRWGFSPQCSKKNADLRMSLHGEGLWCGYRLRRVC